VCVCVEIERKKYAANSCGSGVGWALAVRDVLGCKLVQDHEPEEGSDSWELVWGQPMVNIPSAQPVPEVKDS